MFDVAVLGAGAAGMMCAAVAGQRGLRVVLVDHAERLAEKIRISGGGRCNFTNIGAGPANFLSDNPHFCRSALAGYTPQDFLALLRRHRIAWHEKHRGQLFCDDSSESIIEMLRAECDAGGVQWRMACQVAEVAHGEAGFELRTSQGVIRAAKLVVATGGMAIPQLGATDFGLKLTRQFGLKVVEPRPALVPLTFDAAHWQPLAELSGVALEVNLATGQGKARGEFLEDLLFTHRGLSGPAILQVSSYWRHGVAIGIDFTPDAASDGLIAAKHAQPRLSPRRALGQHLPDRRAETLAERLALPAELGAATDKLLAAAQARLADWSFHPNGSEGYAKAEVTVGGVSTAGLSSRTMEAKTVPGLYFVGEAVDVTGWLGGYNFQWAWASGRAAGEAV